MKQFYLAEIITKDKLVHQGIFYPPKKLRKQLTFAKATAGKAILWVHGLTSTFYNNVKLFELITGASEKNGIGFATFNNRGHDIVTGIRKIDPKETKGYTKENGGAGYERFEECVYDIDAGISFLAAQGYTEIILAGHSTGANKVCYYVGTKKDARVAGVILLSPVSDRLDPTLDKERIAALVRNMTKKIEDGLGDELVSGVHAFPVTPRRFVSLYAPNTSEDTFDYGHSNPKLTSFSAIKTPLLVVLGSHDEYLHQPASDVLDIFAKHTRSRKYQSVIIPDAIHSYNGKEQDLARAVFRWVSQL